MRSSCYPKICVKDTLGRGNIKCRGPEVGFVCGLLFCPGQLSLEVAWSFGQHENTDLCPTRPLLSLSLLIFFSLP